jgi:ribonuclease P protein component
MLSKKSRIGRRGLEEVLRAGKSFRTSYFSIKYLYSESALQCAVVLSKKIAKKAVERNRVRRAVYRALAPHTSKRKGRMVVFVQNIPQGTLTPLFADDLVSVWAKLVRE